MQLREKFARIVATRINETARATSTAVSKGPRGHRPPLHQRGLVQRAHAVSRRRCRHLASYTRSKLHLTFQPLYVLFEVRDDDAG